MKIKILIKLVILIIIIIDNNKYPNNEENEQSESNNVYENVYGKKSNTLSLDLSKEIEDKNKSNNNPSLDFDVSSIKSNGNISTTKIKLQNGKII